MGLVILSRLGFETVLLRSLGAYEKSIRAKSGPRLVLYTTLLTATIALLWTVLAGGLLSIAAAQNAGILTRIIPLLLLGLIVPATICQIMASAAKGWKRPLLSVAIETGAIPAITLSVLGIVWALGIEVSPIFLVTVYVLATIVVAAISFLILLPPPQGWPQGPTRLGSKTMAMARGKRKPASNFLAIELTSFVIGYTPFLVLGFVVSSHEIGIYSAAERLAGLLPIIYFGIASVMAPQIANHWAQRDKQALSDDAQLVTMAMGAAGVASAGGLIIFGPFVLGLFGPDFEGAYLPLVIMAALRGFSFMAGPSLMLLSMANNEKRARQINTVVAIISVSLALLVVPLFGIVGAAVVSGIVGNLSRWSGHYFAKHDLGIQMISIGAWKNLPALIARK